MRTLPLALLLLLAGCTLLPDEQACTLIGCAFDLGVEIEGAPAGGFTLDVVVAGETVASATCSDGPCPFLSFDGVQAEEVTLRLTWRGGSHEETFRPQYRVFQPNGPRCGPVCRQATVRLRVP